MNTNRLSQILLPVAVVLGMYVLIQFWAQAGVKRIGLSDLMGYIDTGKVIQSVKLNSSTGIVSGDFVDGSEPTTLTPHYKKFEAIYDNKSSTDLTRALNEK